MNSSSASTTYDDFIARKLVTVPPTGLTGALDLPASLFPFQSDVTRWACRRGRCAIFAGTGLGKTRMSLSWAREVQRYTGGNILVLAPLAVARQTRGEGAEIGIDVTLCREATDVRPGINVTNYDRLERFAGLPWAGVVCGESSIMKHHTAKTFAALCDAFADVAFKLCETATPAPNDHTELGQHAEFLGICTRQEMLSEFFCHDGGETQKWRLKGHAKGAFWRWVASWAALVRKPSDLGYDDGEYALPPLHMHEHIVEANAATYRSAGYLIPMEARGLSEQRVARKGSIGDRVSACVEAVKAEPGEPWLIWCDLNAEQDALKKAFGDLAFSVQGSDTADEKEAAILAWLAGERPIMISKCSIMGWGLNFQHAARMAFVGVTHCYDAETEILTGRGWMTFDKVTTDDDVATVNPESLAMEWQKPERVIWQHHNGTMLRFGGKCSFDMLVTPNHKMFVRRCPKRHPGSSSDGWFLKPAEEIADRFRRQEYRMLSMACGFRGIKPECIAIPMHDGMRVNSRTVLVREIDPEDFMRLAGWYLSEGHCRPLNEVSAGRIVISQTDVHPENRSEIISLMRRIGLRVNDRTKDITGHSLNLAAFLIDQFGHLSGNKRIPRWVKDLDGELLEILRDTMLKGDGCHRNGIARCYRTNSAQLADDFQEICLKTGIRASVKRREDRGTRHGKGAFFDVVMARTSITPGIDVAPVEIQYDGMIGCVTVPNHTVIVRRNGIPVVSGNSWEAFYQAVRREWRFGQAREVHVHVFVSEAEGGVLANLKRKEADAARLGEELARETRDAVRAEIAGSVRTVNEYAPTMRMMIPAWLKSEDEAAA